MTDSRTPSARRVAVLGGGISHERDISLKSARQVADALSAHGVEVQLLDPDAALLPTLMADPPDAVWPALHGASGEDGALRALLEFLDIPYVGSAAHATRLAWDKPTAKTLVERAGVQTPHSITLTRDAFRELGAESVLTVMNRELPTPLAVKLGVDAEYPRDADSPTATCGLEQTVTEPKQAATMQPVQPHVEATPTP